MPEFSKISQYIDQAGLEKDTAFFIKQLASVEASALNTAVKIKSAMSSFNGTQENASSGGTQKAIKDFQQLNLTTANYTKILAAVGLEIDNLTDKQKQQLKNITDNYKIEEQSRQGAKETVKLIQGEIAANEKLSAGRTGLAQTLAVNLAQIKSEKLERERLARVLSTENGSREKAQATIDLLINKGKKLNLETEQGARVNNAYNKTIEKLNNFLIANGDVESKRFKNIGNYNAAAQLVVTALEKERVKLVELEKQRASYNRAGAAPIAGFGRGNSGDKGPTNSANTGATAYSGIGKDAQQATQEVAALDAEITKSRVVIEGFNRVTADLPIGKESQDARKEVALLAQSLLILEKNGLGSTDAAEQLKKKINELTGGLKQTAAATSAIDQINIEISELNKKLQGTEKGSASFNVLTKQIALLKSVSGGLDKTFGKSTQELRALSEAAQRVAEEFGLGSKEFQRFSKIVGDRKDQIADVKNALKFQSSDTKGLDATLQGVQAIAGAYGAYEAVVALTGEENEALAKSMQKLQAVTALVTSVQSIANGLQSDSALVQGILAIKTGALAAVNQVLAGTTTQVAATLTAETIAAEAAAIASAELAAAELAATGAGDVLGATTAIVATETGLLAGAAGTASAALGAEALAADGLAVGLGGVAVAEGAVAAGASVMATAIAATGIGLIVIAIAAGIYKLVTALQDQSAASASVRKANEALAASLKDLTDATKTYEEINRQSVNRQVADLERLTNKRKALGLTAAASLALDLKTAKLKETLADAEVKANDLTEAKLRKSEANATNSARSVVIANKAKFDYLNKVRVTEDKNFDKTILLLDATIKFQTDAAAATASIYDRDKNMFSAAIDSKQEKELLFNQASKLGADERRKLTQESAKIDAELQISFNDFILSNERSTLERRLDAIKSSQAERKKIIEADNRAAQSDPTLSGADKIIAAKKAGADLLKLNKEGEVQLRELKEAFRIRDLNATLEINKIFLEASVETNTAILNNEELTEAQRLEALKASIAARKILIDNAFSNQLSASGISDKDIERIKNTGFFEVENKKITDEELKKLIGEYNKEQLALSVNVQAQLLIISKDYFLKEKKIREDAFKDIDRANNDSTVNSTAKFSRELIALNKSLTSKEISQGAYEKRRILLETGFAKKSLQIEIERVEKSLAATKSGREIEKQLLLELSDLKKATGPQTDEEKRKAADRIKILTDELEATRLVIGQESDLYKQLAKLKADLSDTGVADFERNQQRIITQLESVQRVATIITDTISGLIGAIGERRKAQIQEQIDGVVKRQEFELAANEASGASEEKRAERIAVINARAAAQKEELEKKQKRIDRDRAVAEKNFSIFQIILATAVNIAKAKNPFLKILEAISGAAQLAIAIATPIPRFKKGLFQDYVGQAIVGDGGKREAIFRKRTGAIEITPATDTLTNIEQGDRIAPDADVVIKMMQQSAMADMVRKTNGKTVSQANFGAVMSMALNANAEKIVSAINNKEQLRMAVTGAGIVSFWQHGSNTTQYINEQTNWNN